MRDLNAAEAAARLGVKQATLYAYVSRGLLHRYPGRDGRTSRFDAGEVDALRSRRRRATEGEIDAVISTGLTRLADGEFSIRGRDVERMVEDGLRFEAAVDWLWDDDRCGWTLPGKVEAAVLRAQASLPDTTAPIDRLRVTAAVVSATDPMRLDPSPAGVCGAGRVLLLAMVAGLPSKSRLHGGETVAEALWRRLTRRRASRQQRAALNAALVLLVDHSLAASTFAARVAASVRADPYSIVVAGLGVVGGRLHGAASTRVHRLLADAGRRGDAAMAVAEFQQGGSRLPGFGHKVYRSLDPRYALLMRLVDEAWRADPRLATAHEVRSIVSNRTDAIPNVDFAVGALSWLAGMAQGAGEAIFAIARTAGWIAHGREEFGEAPVRFRPRARYTGPRPDGE